MKRILMHSPSSFDRHSIRELSSLCTNRKMASPITVAAQMPITILPHISESNHSANPVATAMFALESHSQLVGEYL